MIILNLYTCNSIKNYFLREDEYNFIIYGDFKLDYASLAQSRAGLNQRTVEELSKSRHGRLAILEELFTLTDLSNDRIKKIVNVEIGEFESESSLLERS